MGKFTRARTKFMRIGNGRLYRVGKGSLFRKSFFMGKCGKVKYTRIDMRKPKPWFPKHQYRVITGRIWPDTGRKKRRG